MSILDKIRKANQPGPPEHSIALRVACGGTVVAGTAACAAEGEISVPVTVLALAIFVVGMVFSYRSRSHPRAIVKVLLALAALTAFIWFFRELTGQDFYDATTVEDPLAVLFMWIQVTHGFDVPARRDLSFCLAGSATLMAVAGAQAITMTFGIFVLAWIAFGLWGLVGLWRSQSEGGQVSWRSLVATIVGVSLFTAGVLVVLPAPHVAGAIDFPALPGADLIVPNLGGVAGDGGNASEPAKAGTPADPSRVGGFLGFADTLDTALRASFSDEVVMRVRAQRPSYWLGETFDTWNGQSWSIPNFPPTVLATGSPFFTPLTPNVPPSGVTDLQTFYIAQTIPNLIFHADEAAEVWFPSREIFYETDGSLVSPIALSPGTVYTVRSEVNTATPVELSADSSDFPTVGLPASLSALDTALPHPYPRVKALVAKVIAAAHATTTYAKVTALIGWIGAHTRYSTDIPPLRPGQDTVDEFLFGDRVGYCEQISTSLAVMLRSIGIPAREAVGYVPGPYNPITDLYEVEASDAHAWVQVWFPGYGWQSFDPTAVVPLANPAPGSVLTKQLAHALKDVPVLPVGGALVAVVLAWGATLLVRRRPKGWPEQVARRIERVGARAGRSRGPGETLSQYADALERGGAVEGTSVRELARRVEDAVYGGPRYARAEGREELALARQLRARRHASRHLDVSDVAVGGGPSRQGEPALRQ